MEVLLVTLVLVSLCGGHAFVPPDFCRDKLCPTFTLVQKHQGFEERRYVATEWLTTKIKSTSVSDITSANVALNKVRDYENAWPVLVNVQDGKDYSLSWFVAPGSNPKLTDSVKRETRPAATYYVRVFGGMPSIEEGRKQKKKLCELITAEDCGKDTYIGAGYDPLFSLTHHNEIWIKKNE